MLSEKALKNKKDSKEKTRSPERYTIFHALFEALKEKDKNRREE